MLPKLRSPAPIPILASIALFTVITACDSRGPTADTGQVNVGASIASLSSFASAATATKPSPTSLALVGPNGTLTITDIGLIMGNVELGGPAGRTELEAEPRFLPLPLDPGAVESMASAQVATATYEEITFDVGDAAIQDIQEEDSLHARIEDRYPDWPDAASMVVAGSFTQQGEDAPKEFVTYFQGEAEIKHELSAPLEVTGETLLQNLIIRLDLSRWFAKPDGSLWNLSEYDHERTGALIEFEAEFEKAVTEIEVTDGP